MSDDQTATFMSFTGLDDPTQAQMYLEMAGGNLEMAMSIFFDGGGGMGAAAPAPAAAASSVPDWFRAVWPSSAASSFESIPEAWSMQTLQFEDVQYPGAEKSVGCGLVQPKNGPCGLIAAIQAACIAELIRTGNDGTLKITDEVLVSSLGSILWQAATASDAGKSSAVAKLVTKASSDGVDMVDFTDKDALTKAIAESIDTFKSAGGVVLFLYSLVVTRTVEEIRSDVMKAGGDLPIITELGLCTSDLVALCLRGEANGNVGAFQPISDENGENIKISWPAGLGVGLLSMDEYQTKIPVADALKSPTHPVWLMHGGDHFTVLWSENLKFPNLDGADGERGASFSLLHWNGLPPNGPRLARLNIQAKEQAAPAPKKRKAPTQYEPVIGEIESIVQADPEMKKNMPNGWTTWRYEVQLAGECTKEEGTQYDPRPEGAKMPKTFDLKAHSPAGEEKKTWRCAACYSTRFKTMCFGMNDLKEDGGEGDGDEANDPKCENCGRLRSVSGHTIWLTYDELPDSWRASADRQFAPKIVSVLRTKWPGCKVQQVDDDKFGAGNWPSV